MRARARVTTCAGTSCSPQAPVFANVTSLEALAAMALGGVESEAAQLLRFKQMSEAATARRDAIAATAATDEEREP